MLLLLLLFTINVTSSIITFLWYYDDDYDSDDCNDRIAALTCLADRSVFMRGSSRGGPEYGDGLTWYGSLPKPYQTSRKAK